MLEPEEVINVFRFCREAEPIGSFIYLWIFRRRQWQPTPVFLAWKIPWTEEPGRLQSMGSLRIGHDWVTSLSFFTFMHWRRQWQPIPALVPGESQGWLSWERVCLQCRRLWFDPWVGKIPWRREQLPTPVFWPEKFHGLYSPWDCKESDMTECLSQCSTIEAWK